MAGGRIHRVYLFRSVRKYQRQMGIYSTESNKSDPFNCGRLFLLASLTHFCVPTLLFFAFKANSFKDYADCFYAFSTAFACYSHYFVQMLQIKNFEILTKNYEQFIAHKVHTRMRHYAKLSEIIELLSKVWYFSCYLTVISVIMPQFFLSYINFFIFDLGSESFYLPFPNMLPFDWRTPIGYFVAVLPQCIDAFCVIFDVAPIHGFMFGSCLLFIAFIEDVTTELKNLAPNESVTNNVAEMKKRFCNVIQLYSEVKQFIDQINQIYEFLVFVTLAWCLITICCDFLLLQSEFSNLMEPDAKLIDVISAVQTLSLMFWSFFLVALVCIVGEMVTNQFSQFHEELCQSNWYLFSAEVQQLYLTFIASTQHPGIICGYANILCTRDTFKKTVNTGFSYYMMIRHMKE